MKNAGRYENTLYTTSQVLRNLARHTDLMNPQDYPFPKPKIMADAWRDTRDRLADKLKQPDLKKIPMKNLRNYSGARLYLSLPVRDPIAVMRHLRHKKLETTMHYIRGIILDADDEEYITRTVQLGTPTTIKETIQNQKS
jgi:hypothetical protein